jgi:excinuclease ABC subunit C
VVVDGGKGQLGMALAAARDVGIDLRPGTGLPIVGLAKEMEPAPSSSEAEKSATSTTTSTTDGTKDDGRGRRPDRIYLPHAKDAIPIRPDSAEMFVLQHLRDEAHRFAVTFHRSQRKRRTLRSAIADIPGIGSTRQRSLLRHFGSLKKIREASLEALLAVPGINRKVAQAVLDFFATRPDPAPPPPAAEPPHEPAPVEEADAEEDALESAFAAVDEE